MSNIVENNALAEALIVGAKVKIGKEYAERIGKFFEAGQIIELVEGHFENDNGLFVENQTAPSWWYAEEEDFESIYHLFGNNLELFMDCEVVKTRAKTRAELQAQFYKETETEVVNSQGEFDIDYVQWLEEKIISGECNHVVIKMTEFDDTEKAAISSKPAEIDWKKLRGEFFDKLTRQVEKGICPQYTELEFNCMPHNVFEWFKEKLAGESDVIEKHF
jgi:hypothetical protein